MLMRNVAGRLAVSVASCVGVLALAVSARAESRTHDGLYLSANAGVGYVGSSGDLNPSKLSGLSTPFALWGGYTFGTFAVGVGFFMDVAWAPTYEYESGTDPAFENDGFALWAAAVFADIYPDPKGGLHIMPSIGSGFLAAPVNSGEGIVLGLGVGYDFWVASEFSLGVMGRVLYAPLSMDNPQKQSDVYATIAPALLLTATYQ